MDKLKVYKADNPDVSTETVFSLAFTMCHKNDCDEVNAKRITRDAMADFCEAAGLDVYQHDEQGNAVSILEEKILPAIEDYFRQQFVRVVSAYRQEKAARQQMEETHLNLLHGLNKRRHDQQLEG